MWYFVVLALWMRYEFFNADGSCHHRRKCVAWEESYNV
jgi:hypothetical protein